MRRVITAAILTTLVAGFACLAHGQEWTCDGEAQIGIKPWTNNPDKGETSNPVNIKVIFVRFPNTAEQERHITTGNLAMLENAENVFATQSLGNYNVNYSVLFDPRDSTQTEKWDTSHTSGAYAIMDSILSWPENYQEYWNTLLGNQGCLQGEILKHIQDAYDEEYGETWQSPLDGLDGILFVYSPEGVNGNPLGEGVGGNAGLSLFPNCPSLEKICTGAPTIEYFGCTPNASAILGTQIIVWNSSTNDAVVEIAHEWGHVLGLAHTPSSDRPYEGPGRCSFGSYSIMRAKYPDWGVPHYPIFDHWSRVQLGWTDPTTIGDSQNNLELDDIRNSGGVLIIPIREEEYVPDYVNFLKFYFNEYFLVAFQKGGYPTYGAADSGLYIWHVIDRHFQVVSEDTMSCLPIGYNSESICNLMDLELATGLYGDPSLSPGYWVTPNPNTGVDMLDGWTDVATGTNRANYLQYWGSSNDLFNYGEATEFSYKTNPNSNGYSYNPSDLYYATLDGIDRSTPQTALNSISIIIKGQTSNGVILDILLAPNVDILTPNGGEELVPGLPTTISWNLDDVVGSTGGIIDTVDLYFSPGGEQPEELLGEGVDATVGAFTWIPNGAEATTEGKIKAISHNVNDPNHVGSDDSDAVFSVRQAPEIATAAEYPILANSQDSSTVFAVSVGHPLSFTDMTVTLDATSMGGGAGIALTDDGAGADLVDDDGIYTSQPQDIDVTAGTYSVDVVAEAAIENGGDGGISTASVEVEAVDSGVKMVDGSAGTGDLVSQLQGDPYAATYFKVNIAGDPHYIMGITKDAISDETEVYAKGNVTNGVPQMQNDLSIWFSSNPPISGGRGVSFADYDNDGKADLFICSSGTNTALYRNTGSGFVRTDQTVFSAGDHNRLNHAHVVAWGDYNQDGWVDLFVGTANYSGNMSDIASNPPTGLPNWTLFRNNGGAFVKTSGILPGLPETPVANALSASWNDVDSDGDLDLVVGYIDVDNQPNPKVFINQGYKKASSDFVFYDESTSWGITGIEINSMDWLDYNHDEFPDLVVTGFPGASGTEGAYVFVNELDGSSRRFAIADTLASTGQWEGVAIGDFDQNGEEDVVLQPHSGLPAMMMAESGTSGPSYRDLAYTLGLRPAAGANPAFTSGGFAADFNDDHDLDLYLGRPKTDEFLYKNMREDGVTDPPTSGTQNWVEVSLSTLGNSNYSLIGTKVLVNDTGNGKTWTKIVDGGSGRGCQRPNQLHFGLGQSSATVDITVFWPSGPDTTVTGVSVNTIQAILEDAVPEIQSGSLHFTHKPFAGGADWVFTWLTDSKGDIREDTVEFQYEPGYSGTSACTINTSRVLAWGDQDVIMAVYPSNGYWTHEVTWKNQFCSPDETCHFQFRATSGVSGDTMQSSWKNFGYFDACFTRFPPPQEQ